LCELNLTSKCVAQEIQVQKQFGPVFFNELMWRGSSVSSADEWIELKNDSDEIVDISGWKVIIRKDSNDTIIQIPNNEQIAPWGFYLVANNNKDCQFEGKKSILEIDPDLIDSRLNLNNSDLHLVLNDGERNIDFAGYDINGDEKGNFYNKTICSTDESMTYGKSGCKDDLVHKSLERIKYDDGILPENWMSARQRVDPPTINSYDENTANPQNSGKPKITDFKLSSDIFFQGKQNKYLVTYTIDDSKDDLEKVSLQIYNGQEVVDPIEISQTGNKIELNYNFCPTILLTAEDETGLTDEYDLDLTCAYLNKNLLINEVMPHPKNKDWDGDGKLGASDEWIEISNPTGEDTILSGWIIKDKSGKEFGLGDYVIKAKSYLVLYKNATKISLNDDGDSLYLVDPTGSVIDVANIPKSTKYEDLAYGRFDKGWDWTKSVTLGKKNVFTLMEDTTKEDDEAEAEKDTPTIVRAVADITKSESRESEPEIISTIITTTSVIKRHVPEVIASGQIAPIVLGSRIKRNDSPGAFIRFEYLLYLLGFVAFILLVFCYEICRRE